MRRCLIAQSGGPTPVINASVAGVLMENKLNGYFDEIYGGINGIEGILKERLVYLSDMDENAINNLKYTPSSGLGSCRYRLKSAGESPEEYERFFKILDKYQIDTFFYVGGNDSMDTVSKLSGYAREHSIDKKILGIPKTIDNDLVNTDHCPGFGSAARLIATTTLETYLDSTVYSNNGIFILETMGRDTGWLAASSVLATINDKPVVDFIYLPERAFDKEVFLKDVERVYKEKKHVYIVVSEGLKDSEGKYLSEIVPHGGHDNFGHAQLGGVAGYLKSLIIDSGITSRVKTLELGVIQRCGMHMASSVDIEEAFSAGKAAVNYAVEGFSGYMIGIRRTNDLPYEYDFFLIDASEVCNKIKHFPLEWISASGNFVTAEAVEYLRPLIYGDNSIEINAVGLPVYYSIDKNNLVTK
ncbi:6-phosphofructokinase [Clostridium thermarum]|uniref:6-phosphofructokinase n=1 Tax=Clostridium thermarum TaxID=1716543 RepID=UPI0013D6EB5F|nr:6-phosphofructokinase [Clostridium thermarum]